MMQFVLHIRRPKMKAFKYGFMGDTKNPYAILKSSLCFFAPFKVFEKSGEFLEQNTIKAV